VYWLLPPFQLITLASESFAVPQLNLILALICRQYLADGRLKDPTFTVLPIIFGGDNPHCQIPEVQALVSRFMLYGNLISGILSAIMSPKLGSLSDRYGRNKLIAVAALGMLIGKVATIAIATWPDLLSVHWLFLGFFFNGICGSFITLMALSHAYATDCTTQTQRNVAFGYFHGCLFIGIAVGPVLGGYIIKATGHILTVFYIALGCHLLSMAVLLFAVPESLSRERQRVAREKIRIEKESAGNSLHQTWFYRIQSGNLLAPLDILFPTGEGSTRAIRYNLILLSAIDTIMFGVTKGSITVVIIYSEFMFGWGNFETSIFLSIVNTCRVLILLVVLPIVTLIVRGRSGASGSQSTRKSGMDALDINIIRAAILFDTIGYIGYSIVRSGPLFTLSGVVASAGAMGSPTLQSSLTKHVPSDKMGQLLGATGLLHALARVVSPIVFNLTYSLTVGKFTQTVFICLVSTFGIAFVSSWFLKPHSR